MRRSPAKSSRPTPRWETRPSRSTPTRSPPGCSASSLTIPPTWRNSSMLTPTRKPLPTSHAAPAPAPGAPVARPASVSLAELEDHGAFERRHIGPDAAEQAAMLAFLGFASRAALIDAVIPHGIRRKAPLAIASPRTEGEALAELRTLAQRNHVFKSYIGMGYYGTHTPGVILRNVMENPAWYTAYTPYQPEISQGRLEALLNFQ